MAQQYTHAMPTPCNASDFQSLSRLLDQALRLPADSTEGWLACLPPAARHLAPRLRVLLQLHHSGACAGFMANSPRLNDTAPQAGVQAGHRAGPYKLLRPIGRGGMCTVWLAEHTGRRGRPRFAVKLPHQAPDANLARRMARERDITAQMAHPNVTRLRDAGTDADGRPYLVLDRVDGKPLDQWCQQQQIDIDGRLRLGVQLARALAHVHSRGVVHRDLKPANVLVSAGGQVHLLDFGIACQCPAAAPPEGASASELSLTPAYASPEQRRGDATTFSSDMFSLGIVMFELLTGQLPEGLPGPQAPQGPHERPVRSGLRHPVWGLLAPACAPVRPRAAPLAGRMASDAPSAARLQGPIDALLRKAMARRPERRHASALAFADALQACLNSNAAMGAPARRQPVAAPVMPEVAAPVPSAFKPTARPQRAACPDVVCVAV